MTGIENPSVGAMSRWRHQSWASGGGVVVLLAVAYLVVLTLIVQSFMTLRSHRAMVETTLEDFAGFGAERIATELDQFYGAFIPERLELAQAAHYRWVADPDIPHDIARPERPIPPGTISAYFSLADGGVVVHGSEIDASTRAWIEREVRGHLPSYPPPAPYVVLRSDDARALVYRRDEAYGRESLYGFILHFDAPVEWYRRVVDRTALLPRSLIDEASSRELFDVGIHLAPDEPALYRRELPALERGPEAWAFAPKAGRMAVRVRLDAEMAEELISGIKPATSLYLLSFLALLSASLLYVAIALQRRSARLVGLRESFVANVSHDLRTPITQIRMFSETLRRGHFNEPEERDRALAIIERQTEVIDDLVDNLLHASGRHGSLRPEPTDLGALVTEVIDGMGPLANARGVRIALVSVDGGEPLVDPIAATRILTNLVDNAVRHGREGGRIEITATHGVDVSFIVDDDGPGIPHADRERVFWRFEQRGSSAAGGTGLGLTVVRALAQRHDGDAHIETSPLGGTRVVVRLGAVSEDGA